MKRVVFATLAFALVSLGLTGSAAAGTLQTLLSFDGTVDLLSDESASVVRDVGTAGGQTAGNGILDLGDVVQGIFEIRAVNGIQTGSVGGTIVGTTSLEVTGIGVNSLGATVYTFGTVGTAQASNVGTWDLATILSGAGFDTTGMTTYLGGGTASFAVFDRGDGNFTIQKGFANSLALDGTMTDLGLVGAEWSVEVLGGLVDAADFYEASFSGAGGLPVSIASPFPPGTTIGGFATAFSVTEHRFSSDTVFKPVTTFDLSTFSSHSSDVATQSNGVLSVPDQFTPDGFTLADDGNFVMNPVPEPSSMILLGLGLSGVFGYGLRRRKNASAA